MAMEVLNLSPPPQENQTFVVIHIIYTDVYIHMVLRTVIKAIP